MNAVTPTTPQPSRPATPQAALRLARTVVAAMAGGVLVFWAVVWFVTEGGARPFGASGFSPRVAATVWSVLALGTFAGALVFRGRAAGVVEEARRSGGAPAIYARSGETQSFIIVAMALLEVPALFAGVAFLLLGTVQLLFYAAPIYLLGVALTFPRAEWFGANPAREGR